MNNGKISIPFVGTGQMHQEIRQGERRERPMKWDKDIKNNLNVCKFYALQGSNELLKNRYA